MIDNDTSNKFIDILYLAYQYICYCIIIFLFDTILMKKFPLRIYAHRGDAKLFPENTIPAFRRAIEERASHLELDIRCTSDSELVVIHDEDGKRVSGVSKAVKDCTLKEVQSWDLCNKFIARNKSIDKAELKKCYIPKLSEVLEAFPLIPLNLDIKDSRSYVVEKLVSFLHKRGEARRVFLTSFRSKVVSQLRHLCYRGETSVSPLAVFIILFSPPLLWSWLSISGTALQIPRIWRRVRLDSARFIYRCHVLGKRVDYWTINEPQEALRLLKLGADGIFTDNLCVIRDVVLSFARENNREVEYL